MTYFRNVSQKVAELFSSAKADFKTKAFFCKNPMTYVIMIFNI